MDAILASSGNIPVVELLLIAVANGVRKVFVASFTSLVESFSYL